MKVPSEVGSTMILVKDLSLLTIADMVVTWSGKLAQAILVVEMMTVPLVRNVLRLMQPQTK